MNASKKPRALAALRARLHEDTKAARCRRGLLRARGERPRRGAAEKYNEVAPSHASLDAPDRAWGLS